MADYYGALVGAVLSASNTTPLVAAALLGGQDHVLVRDRIELVDAVAENDRVSLGKIRADAIINPTASMIYFDDLGASITMDVGATGAENALVAAQDVATAAGSCALFKSVDIANYWKPLWEVLGLSANPGGTIELFAKLEGGNPGTGTMAWQIMGQPK